MNLRPRVKSILGKVTTRKSMIDLRSVNLSQDPISESLAKPSPDNKVVFPTLFSLDKSPAPPMTDISIVKKSKNHDGSTQTIRSSAVPEDLATRLRKSSISVTADPEPCTAPIHVIPSGGTQEAQEEATHATALSSYHGSPKPTVPVITAVPIEANFDFKYPTPSLGVLSQLSALNTPKPLCDHNSSEGSNTPTHSMAPSPSPVTIVPESTQPSPRTSPIVVT